MAFNVGAPPVDRLYLMQIFSRIDRDGSGRIAPNELQAALNNGTWAPFNMKTVEMIMNMFDRERRGSLSLDDFVGVWNYITQWQQIFTQFDRDRSGSIDRSEMMQALNTFGYRLSPQFYNVFMARYDTQKTGTVTFDDFIHACISLSIATDTFKKHENSLTGTASFSYEEFLNTVFGMFAK